MKVKLNEKLDKPGHGFVDPENGQRIRPKLPKEGEPFERGQTLEVKDTAFVREKLRTGELLLPSQAKEAEKKDGK